jgi:AcrR family transcriptional regulator
MAGTFTAARREAVRSEIIAVAERVFTRRGVAATSMAQIAEAVGIGRPALYYYFPSKDELVDATIRTAVDRYESWRSVPKDATFTEAVKYFFTKLVHNIAVTDEGPLRFFYTVLLEQFDDDSDQQPVRAIIESYRQQVEHLVRLGLQHGDVARDIDAGQVADELTAHILGMQWMWMLYPGQVDLEAIAARLERQLLGTLSEHHD